MHLTARYPLLASLTLLWVGLKIVLTIALVASLAGIFPKPAAQDENAIHALLACPLHQAFKPREE
jgi:hypothetical protein